MRNFARLGIDLAWVALSAFLAQVVCDNFVFSIPRLQAIAPYALLCVVSAAIVFKVAGLNKGIWRYTSLLDALHLVGAATVALLLALVMGFAIDRLEDVARSVPVVQWLLLVGALVGTRIALRLWQGRSDRKRKSFQPSTPLQHVLVVGVNDLAELYLSSLTEFAPGSLAVVGILSRGRTLHGRSLRQHNILGAPEDVARVVSQLDVHGVTVDRIVVMQRFDQLSKTAQHALLEVERSTAIKVEWLPETLGWGAGGVASGVSTDPDKKGEPLIQLGHDSSLSRRGHAFLKRTIDVAAAIGLVIAVSPLLLLLALIVATDVGLPIVFWQQRPGRHGRPFKLYKFRTMRPAHDAQGNRIADELRSSRVGSFLRRSRLDELPQLCNIIVGEMSFVGPRPLLPVDQPQENTLRLMARPGLTGWAQVNGGREISNHDKAALDAWYITNASLWLDIEILLRTMAIMVLGDRVNGMAVNAAHARLDAMTMRVPVWPTQDASPKSRARHRCGRGGLNRG